MDRNKIEKKNMKSSLNAAIIKSKRKKVRKKTKKKDRSILFVHCSFFFLWCAAGGDVQIRNGLHHLPAIVAAFLLWRVLRWRMFPEMRQLLFQENSPRFFQTLKEPPSTWSSSWIFISFLLLFLVFILKLTGDDDAQ
jgi:hypothetical protein